MKRLIVCLLMVSVAPLACQTTGSPKTDVAPAQDDATSEPEPESDLFRIPDDPFGDFERSTDAMPSPITYTIGAVEPSEDATTYRVYQDAGLTLMMPEDVDVSEFPTLAARNRFGNYEELFVSGEGFGQHLVIPADRYYIVDDRGFDAGEVYDVSMDNRTVEGVVDKFDVSVVRGDRSRKIAGVEVREYRLNASYTVTDQAKQDEESSARGVEETSVLWIDEDRPYTPSFLPPLIDAERVFSSAAEERLGLHIYELAREGIADAGLVLGVDILDESGEAVFSVESSEIVETDVIEYAPERKVVTTAERFMGMFSLGMLRRGLNFDALNVEEEEDNGLSAAIEGPVSTELNGTAVFGGTADKPPMIVMVATKDGAESDASTALMFAMAANEQGSLEVGTYKLDLEGASPASAAEAAGQPRGFDSLGLLSVTRSQGSSTYPCVNAADGELVIESASDGELNGTFDFKCVTEGVGELTPVPRESTIRVSGTFSAQRAPDAFWK